MIGLMPSTRRWRGAALGIVAMLGGTAMSGILAWHTPPPRPTAVATCCAADVFDPPSPFGTTSTTVPYRVPAVIPVRQATTTTVGLRVRAHSMRFPAAAPTARPAVAPPTTVADAPAPSTTAVPATTVTTADTTTSSVSEPPPTTSGGDGGMVP